MNKASEIKIRLDADGIVDFVKTATECDFDIDVHCERIHVDGKSILGIFSLDLSKPITLEVYADNCEDLMEEIKPFIIG